MIVKMICNQLIIYISLWENISLEYKIQPLECRLPMKSNFDTRVCSFTVLSMSLT